MSLFKAIKIVTMTKVTKTFQCELEQQIELAKQPVVLLVK